MNKFKLLKQRVEHRLGRFISCFLCAISQHKQSPCIEQRQLTTRKQKHVRFEYQCTCDRCGIKSNWMRWKYYPNPPKKWKEMYS